MSFEMRWDQCCDSEGCRKPAHLGSLCAACFFAATPARRAVELGCQDLKDGAAAVFAARAERERVARLQVIEALFAAPAYGEAA